MVGAWSVAATKSPLQKQKLLSCMFEYRFKLFSEFYSSYSINKIDVISVKKLLSTIWGPWPPVLSWIRAWCNKILLSKINIVILRLFKHRSIISDD